VIQHGGRTGLARFPPAGGTPNPYTDLLYGALGDFGFEVMPSAPLELPWLWHARRRVGFLHFHWRPDKYYAPRRASGAEWDGSLAHRGLAWLDIGGFALRLAAARALGYRVAWTVHEVYPPPSSNGTSAARRLHRIGERVLARFSHVLLAHDRPTADRAGIELGLDVARIAVLPHGSYVGAYPPGRARSIVRKELGLATGDFVFLCFGQLRADKRIGAVLRAFSSLRAPAVKLVVAGEVAHEPSGRSVVEAAHVDPRIRPLLVPVAHERVAELFDAADAAVLARSEVWTSGSLILALSLGVPAIAARRPPHEELLGGEAGWLFEPDDPASLRSALEKAATDTSLARAKRAAALRRARSLPTWHEIAKRTAMLLREG